MTKKMRTRVLRVNWTVVGAIVMMMAVGSLIFSSVAFAANPPPVQTYFVPLPEAQLRTMLLQLYGSTGSTIPKCGFDCRHGR